MFTSASLFVQPRAGLTGTQQGEVRATIYRRHNTLSLASLPLDGRRQTDANPSIVGAQVQLTLGGAATFQLTLKVPEGLDLLAEVQDDDWIDIEMGLGGITWHVMRGMIDQVRVNTGVSPQGAVSRSWLIVGQSFQKVWQQTPMWFSSIYADSQSLQQGGGSVAGLAQLGVGQNVPDTLASFLFSYANRVAQAGRSSVALPNDMPATGQDFGTSWRLDASDFSDADAPRRSLLANTYHPNQNVWDVAQSWSDPFYVEMFCALLPAMPVRRMPREGSLTGYQSVNASSAMATLAGEAVPLPQGLSVERSAMTLVVRNKPFIHISPLASRQTGFASPWFALPMLEVDPQQVVATDLGRNGMERCNAFFCASQVMTGTGGSSLVDTALPLWSVPDMRDHGMRPMDVMTQYVPSLSPKQPALTPSLIYQKLRARLRDYYCANGVLLSGNVTFGRGFPQLQPGMRLRLKAAREIDQVTGYVESVSHSYAPGQGVQTVAGITRAYKGTDSGHLFTLKTLVAEYTAPLA